MLSVLNEFVEQKLCLCNTRLIIFHLMKVTRHTIFLLILYTIITKLEMEIKCVIISLFGTGRNIIYRSSIGHITDWYLIGS
ncbi:hypothetical protein GLOIN_2v32649 [Rhizophagus irregularis DAOM 181602=DAOM 197198]|nr:hypothetical protein GLOIN_2v32649 [Rhizophagus irregularis DAOM 181602=DAOM 197198]